MEMLQNILETGKAETIPHSRFGDILVEQGTTGKHGYGLRHIIENRFKNDGLSVKEITALLYLLPDTLRYGKEIKDIKGKNEQGQDNGLYSLERNGITALVSKMRFDEKEQFILTGYQEKTKSQEAKDATQAGIARYSYTPEFVGFQKQVGAVLSSLGLDTSSTSSPEKSSPNLYQLIDDPAEKALDGVLFQRVYHGTPHKIEGRMSTDKIGTGEGAQAYGYGLYFASRKEIGESYAKKLSKKNVIIDNVEYEKVPSGWNKDKGSYYRNAKTKIIEPADTILGKALLALSINGNIENAKERLRNIIREDDRRFPTHKTKHYYEIKEGLALLERAEIDTGHLYTVEVPEDNELLDYDKPFSEQPDGVKKSLEKLRLAIGGNVSNLSNHTGKEIYEMTAKKLGRDKSASALLKKYGIKGIRYLDRISRKKSEGTHNYVIFADEDIAEPKMLYQLGGEQSDNEGNGRLSKAAVPNSNSVTPYNIKK